MKKISIFIGSPRKNGNSNIMADELLKNLNNGKSTAEKVYLYDFEIKACTDCRACKKGEMLCPVDDGMKDLYSKIDNSEVLIFATPIYWFGPTAVTKLLLDRFRPYYGNKKLYGKKAALLLPAGTGEKDCDLSIEMFKRSFEALGIKYIGVVTAEAYDKGDVYYDKKALENISHLAMKISGE
jgi:multimeric flavodoxin WrbA